MEAQSQNVSLTPKSFPFGVIQGFCPCPVVPSGRSVPLLTPHRRLSRSDQDMAITLLTPLAISMIFTSRFGTATLALNLASGDLIARQANYGLNLTGISPACIAECTNISDILSACADNVLCRCADHNFSLLEDCVECVLENEVASNPSTLEIGNNTLSQFSNQCTGHVIPLSIVATASVSPTAPPIASLESGPFQSPTFHSNRHSVNKGAIAGAIAGGLVLVVLSIWYFVHRNSFKSVTFARKRRPFYRLKEVDFGPPPGLTQKV